MTKIVLALPDDLAERAREAGLLEERQIQDLLREALRRRAARKLSAMTETSVDEAGRPATEEEAQSLVQEAIDAVRDRR